MKKSIIIKFILGISLGYHIFKYAYIKESLKKERYQTQKLNNLLNIANQIIANNIAGELIHKKLEKKNISSIAIYGMAEIGEHIMEDILLHSSIRLLYGIDRRAKVLKMAVPVYTLEETVDIEKPEVVILTSFTENDHLKTEIEEKMLCEVITIGELLYE